MTEAAGTNARSLVEQARGELAATDERIRRHGFLDELRAGQVPAQQLRALAGEQHVIVSSDRRSFAALATRFSAGLAGEFFLDMSQGEGAALGKLGSFADWLGMTTEDFREYEPRPDAHAYPAYVSWLALNATRSEVAVAFLTNLAAWGQNCGAVAAALREAYQAPDEAVAFFELFANPPEDFESRALAVVDEGLTAGDAPLRARRAARLLQAYELSFWDSLTEAGPALTEAESLSDPSGGSEP